MFISRLNHLVRWVIMLLTFDIRRTLLTVCILLLLVGDINYYYAHRNRSINLLQDKKTIIKLHVVRNY
jgi:hypothetical protein